MQRTTTSFYSRSSVYSCMMSHPGYISHAQSKGSKLGYYRASLACDHCRKRKIRCLPCFDDFQGRCANCVRLGRRCVAVKVEVMHALDDLKEDASPEGIIRAQLHIGHLKRIPTHPNTIRDNYRIEKFRIPATSREPAISSLEASAMTNSRSEFQKAECSSLTPLLARDNFDDHFSALQSATQINIEPLNGRASDEGNWSVQSNQPFTRWTEHYSDSLWTNSSPRKQGDASDISPFNLLPELELAHQDLHGGFDWSGILGMPYIEHTNSMYNSEPTPRTGMGPNFSTSNHDHHDTPI